LVVRSLWVIGGLLFLLFFLIFVFGKREGEPKPVLVCVSVEETVLHCYEEE
jgi:hypothetical protein